MFGNKKGAGGATPTPLINHRDSTPMNSSIVAPPCPSGTSNTVVLTGVDTLVATAGGALSPSTWLINQQLVWSDYQKQYDWTIDTPMEIQLGDTWWVLKPYTARQYKYVLDNPEIGHIRVWNVDKWSSAVLNKQHIYIDFRSSWIHQHKIEDLYDAVIAVIQPFFKEELQPHHVLPSRGDIHCDITNGNSFLSESQVRNTITRSKYRNYYNGDDTIQFSDEEKKVLMGAQSYYKAPQKLIEVLFDKVNRMIDRQESIGADNIVFNKDIETAYYGKMSSDVWSKVYDKTKQVKCKNDDDTPALWMENGWNGIDTVVRTEFSLRRAFIKQMDDGKYLNLQDFINNIHKIWDWMTTKWMRMVDEVKKNNTQLSEVSNFWKVVQSAFKECAEKVIRKRTYTSRLSQLIKQGLGCLKKAGSIGMNNNDDKHYLNLLTKTVGDTLTSSYHSGEIYHNRLSLGLS